MTHRLRLLALASLASVASCYAPDNPICGYSCGSAAANNGHCPWDYECRQDNFCHLKGSVGDCPFPVLDMTPPPDMARSAPQDLSTPPDMVTVYDLTMPTCTDNVKNGNETDVDCGGGSCPACAEGRTCVTYMDCKSGVCTAGVCVTPDMAMTPPDISMPPDIATPPDMSMPPDMAMRLPDLATPPDMSMPDMANPPDLS